MVFLKKFPEIASSAKTDLFTANLVRWNQFKKESYLKFGKSMPERIKGVKQIRRAAIKN